MYPERERLARHRRASYVYRPLAPAFVDLPEPSPSSDHVSVAAILVQRSRDDRKALLDDLAAMLIAVVPGVHVERTLFRRNVTTVRLPVGGYVYVLKKGAGDSFEAARQQEVRGVVVRTVPMDIHAFLEELGVALEVELRRTDQGRDALRRWLTPTDS
jgi:hypothetical protein